MNCGGAADGGAQFDQASLRLLSNNFGPLEVPYTANFADIYAFITVVLYDGELHRCLSRSRLNLFEHGPSCHCRPHHNISQSLLETETILVKEILCIQAVPIDKSLLDALRSQGLPNWNFACFFDKKEIQYLNEFALNL